MFIVCAQGINEHDSFERQEQNAPALEFYFTAESARHLCFGSTLSIGYLHMHSEHKLLLINSMVIV